MSAEDVNTRFPIMKYKTWRASREQEGLPAAGGITAPPSRAGSVKAVEGTIGDRKSTDDRPMSSASIRPAATTATESSSTQARLSEDVEKSKVVQTEVVTNDEKSKSASTTVAADDKAATDAPLRRTSTADDSDDEDAPIAAAADAAVEAPPGDTCAICLDTLEDDDDVRGLTCGHAYHIACIDPWLTTRRASCPLCKHDYYVPKPKPEGTEDNARGNVDGRMNMPVSPRTAFLNAFSAPRRHNHGARNRGRSTGEMWRAMTVTAAPRVPDTSRSPTRAQQVPPPGSHWFDRFPFSRNGMPGRNEQRAAATTTTTTPAATAETASTPVSRINPFQRLWPRGNRAENNADASNPTPGQLEAGAVHR